MIATGNTPYYEVALSFAGEQREYVEDVARALQRRGIAVFYDAFEDLWGSNLPEVLHAVYEERASLAVMFISKEYVDKAWPRHERRSIFSRAVQENNDYVLPVRFDDTHVPGLPTGVHYLLADQLSPAEIASRVAMKLGVKPFAGKASDVPPPRATSLTGEVSFDYSSYNGRYVIGRGELEFETAWTKASNMSIYIYNDPNSINGVALAREVNSINTITNAAALDYTSRVRSPLAGQVVVLRNIEGFYAAVHILRIKDDTRGDTSDEVRFRYAIQSDGSDDFSRLL